MAYSEQQVQALRDAVASGVLSVQHGDRRIEYRSMKDLLAALRLAEGQLNTATGKPRVRRIRIVCDPGY